MTMIEQYMNRIKTATASKSKTINLTLSDAQILSMEIANITSSQNKNLNKIVLLQDAIISLQHKQSVNNNVNLGDVNMDGGEF